MDFEVRNVDFDARISGRAEGKIGPDVVRLDIFYDGAVYGIVGADDVSIYFEDDGSVSGRIGSHDVDLSTTYDASVGGSTIEGAIGTTRVSLLVRADGSIEGSGPVATPIIPAVQRNLSGFTAPPDDDVSMAQRAQRMEIVVDDPIYGQVEIRCSANYDDWECSGNLVGSIAFSDVSDWQCNEESGFWSCSGHLDGEEVRYFDVPEWSCFDDRRAWNCSGNLDGSNQFHRGASWRCDLENDNDIDCEGELQVQDVAASFPANWACSQTSIGSTLAWTCSGSAIGVAVSIPILDSQTWE